MGGAGRQGSDGYQLLVTQLALAGSSQRQFTTANSGCHPTDKNCDDRSADHKGHPHADQVQLEPGHMGTVLINQNTGDQQYRINSNGQQGKQIGPQGAQQSGTDGQQNQQVGDQWVGSTASVNQQDRQEQKIQGQVQCQLVLGDEHRMTSSPQADRQ